MNKILINHSILETPSFSIHQDWEVPIPAFFIIASKRKIKSIAELTPSEAAEFIDSLSRLRKGMKNVLKIDIVYIFQNEDTDHFFHVWIFPRYSWMEKFGKKIESVRPIVTYAKQNMMHEKNLAQVKKAADKIKKYMQS